MQFFKIDVGLFHCFSVTTEKKTHKIPLSLFFRQWSADAVDDHFSVTIEQSHQNSFVSVLQTMVTVVVGDHFSVTIKKKSVRIPLSLSFRQCCR